ncbi:hypothetical protein K7432_017693 [Basidiobolus ranarum]|uniref:Uncharacterized protein n=1 Tax=Basidiobolus ranarum TaxID=34480 RepID=A0ABR2VKA1_9FUNG
MSGESENINNATVQFDGEQSVPDNEQRNLNATAQLSKKVTQQSTAAISIMSDYGWSDDGGPAEEEGDEEDLD